MCRGIGVQWYVPCTFPSARQPDSQPTGPSYGATVTCECLRVVCAVLRNIYYCPTYAAYNLCNASRQLEWYPMPTEFWQCMLCLVEPYIALLCAALHCAGICSFFSSSLHGSAAPAPKLAPSKPGSRAGHDIETPTGLGTHKSARACYVPSQPPHKSPHL